MSCGKPATLYVSRVKRPIGSGPAAAGSTGTGSRFRRPRLSASVKLDASSRFAMLRPAKFARLGAPQPASSVMAKAASTPIR